MRGHTLLGSTRRGVRAFSAGSLAALLAVSSVGVAAADTVSTTDPAEGAAGYLVSALVDGERIQSEFEGDFFDAPGVTADTVYALAAVGVASGSITAATDWLETQAGSYSGFGDDVSTGGTGKLLIVAATTDRDPRDFGGVDLVEKVEATEVTDPDESDAGDLLGRYRDVSDFGDFSSPLTHSLVLLGLHRADGTEPSSEAVALLLDAQCDDGGFASQFPSEDDPDPGCSSSVDTTGYAVQALHALGEDDAVNDAVAWLESVQAAEGSFGSADGQNTNSAGLAALAISLGGGDAGAVESARAFIAGVQDGPDTDTPGAIPFNADERGFVELATAQSVPGLVGVSLADVSADGASSEVPTFAREAADDADGTGEDTEEAPADEADDASGGDEADDLSDGGDAVQDADEEQEIEQPTRVDSGVSPSGPPAGTVLVVLAMLAGLSLLVAALPRRRGIERV
jgi:hypothetical protein